ncbi:unnamed protein product [Penicillium salamii]|uniref:Uncharacterized protein n=1 Tax=Penicillium salamii TaxID=1612424 RepID=A0A9W4I821_9EURO|nr:unnamed protein product [Penicillium salamii]CAG7969047.1 unnamed protein product [Penicillium salamii]CAG8040046.1 unnamed protein product [Penicillium salamii]CAG8066875.1 unnamed protein product [Penicillium salamii]CAG8161565.1 unnamed protein product [Penicillium salamii]
MHQWYVFPNYKLSLRDLHVCLMTDLPRCLQSWLRCPLTLILQLCPRHLSSYPKLYNSPYLTFFTSISSHRPISPPSAVDGTSTSLSFPAICSRLSVHLDTMGQLPENVVRQLMAKANKARYLICEVKSILAKYEETRLSTELSYIQARLGLALDNYRVLAQPPPAAPAAPAPPGPRGPRGSRWNKGNHKPGNGRTTHRPANVGRATPPTGPAEVPDPTPVPNVPNAPPTIHSRDPLSKKPPACSYGSHKVSTSRVGGLKTVPSIKREMDPACRLDEKRFILELTTKYGVHNTLLGEGSESPVDHLATKPTSDVTTSPDASITGEFLAEPQNMSPASTTSPTPTEVAARCKVDALIDLDSVADLIRPDPALIVAMGPCYALDNGQISRLVVSDDLKYESH